MRPRRLPFRQAPTPPVSPARPPCVTAHLKGGDLTAQGLFTEPFREPHHPTVFFAVTGGTGTYSGATGYVRVHEATEEETDYTFHLLAS